MKKLLIFDLDNTLYNEVDYVYSGFKAVARFLSKKCALNDRTIFRELKNHFLKYGRGKNFNHILKKFKIRGVKIKKLVEIYQHHKPKIKLYKGTDKILSFLKKKYTLVLLTNGWPIVQEAKIEALSLSKYFDSCYLAQEKGLNFAKPHPKYFRKILKYYRVGPEEAVMVGDDPKVDGVGAAAVSIKTFLIRMPSDLKKISKFLKAK